VLVLKILSVILAFDFPRMVSFSSFDSKSSVKSTEYSWQRVDYFISRVQMKLKSVFHNVFSLSSGKQHERFDWEIASSRILLSILSIIQSYFRDYRVSAHEHNSTIDGISVPITIAVILHSPFFSLQLFPSTRFVNETKKPTWKPSYLE